MPISSEYPLSISKTWAKAVELWRKSFYRVSPLLLLWIIWLFLPFFFLGGKLPSFTVSISYIILYALVALFFYAAVYHRVYFVLLKRRGGIHEAIWFALKKMPYLIIALIISTVLISLGLALLLIPGIYFIVVFWFYFPVILFADKGPFAAFNQCFKLIKDYWWHTVVVVGVPALIFYLVAFIINYFSFGFELFSPVENPKKWFFGVFNKMMFAILYLPFFASVIVIHWQNLKAHYKKRVAAESSEVPVAT